MNSQKENPPIAPRHKPGSCRRVSECNLFCTDPGPRHSISCRLDSIVVLHFPSTSIAALNSPFANSEGSLPHVKVRNPFQVHHFSPNVAPIAPPFPIHLS